MVVHNFLFSHYCSFSSSVINLLDNGGNLWQDFFKIEIEFFLNREYPVSELVTKNCTKFKWYNSFNAKQSLIKIAPVFNKFNPSQLINYKYAKAPHRLKRLRHICVIFSDGPMLEVLWWPAVPLLDAGLVWVTEGAADILSAPSAADRCNSGHIFTPCPELWWPPLLLRR